MRNATVWPSDVKLMLEALQAHHAANGDKQSEFALQGALEYIQQLEARLIDTGRVCFVANHADFSKKKIQRELHKAAGLCMAIEPVMSREVRHG